MYTGLPVSESGIQTLLEKELAGAKKNTIAGIQALDAGQAPAFAHPVFLCKENIWTYWSDHRYSLPERCDTQKDRLFYLEENGIQHVGHQFLHEGYTVTLLIPVIRDHRFLPSSPTWIFRHRINPSRLDFGPVAFNLTADLQLSFRWWHWLAFGLLLVLTGVLGSQWMVSASSRYPVLKKSHSLPLFFLILFLLTLPSAYAPFFSTHWLTKPLGLGFGISTNYLTLFSIFSWFITQIALYSVDTQSGKEEQKKRLEVFRVMSCYLIVAISGLITLTLIRLIFLSSGLDLPLERLYSLGVQEIAWLLLFLLIFSSYFSFVQYLFSRMLPSPLHSRSKWAGMFAGILILLAGKWWIDKDLPGYALVLSYVILVTALELYRDKKALSSAWIFSWMILISAFLAFILFNIDFRRDELERSRNVESMIHNRDPKLEAFLISKSGTSLPFPVRPDSLRVDPDQSSLWRKHLLPINDSLFFHYLKGAYLLMPTTETNDIQQVIYYPSRETEGSGHTEIKEKNERFAVFYHNRVLLNKLDGIKTDSSLLEKLNDPQAILYQNSLSWLKKVEHSGLSIVHVQSIPGILRPLSVFPLLFFLLSLVLFSLSLTHRIIPIIPSWLDLSFLEKKSLRNRIQISIIGLIIASFFITGMVSHFYLQRLGLETNRIVQLDEAQILQQQLDFDFRQPGDRTPNERIEAIALSRSILAEKPLNWYDAGGRQIKEILNPPDLSGLPGIATIPISLLQEFGLGQQTRFFITDRMIGQGVLFRVPGSFSQGLFTWVPAIGEQVVSKRISDILATFLCIYTLLFILSGAIAILLSNSITRPIEILGNTLRSIKLSRQNEILEWKNDDEIGTLISKYNDMIQKLGENARLMAKIERDTAWKEMAKQVAHEIKNPLTPLKLNIQYLEAKVRSNPEDAPSLITQITPSLIEQIDNLSQIASEFSNFAQLPSANNEKVRLNEIVKKVHDFFRKREDLDFQLFVPINDILVFADKNHLVRVLNNVVKNAIQSIPPEREGEIIIRLFTNEANAIIQVTDNGTGIPEDMRDKVFSPNFTTKSSGTGLGLAISTNMLEAFNGRIYFESQVDVGTDFFIEIPLMRLEDNYPKGDRVYLDD